MNGLPYYQAYPRDFFEGTVGLSFELKGAYRLVVDLIYIQGGKLPDDPRYISGMLGCSVRKWKSLRQGLISFGKIRAENGFISNSRADKELEKLRTRQEVKAENRRRPNKINGLESRQLTEPEPEPEPDRDTPKKGVSSTPRQELEKFLSPECAENVLQHRQRIRKPLTVHAAKLLAAKFGKCRDPAAAVDMMIANGWQGFEVEWFENRSVENERTEITADERLAILKS